ncbi:MAG: hypothetical protein AB8G05_24950 [Oligoflexales bacterium]
MNKKLSRREAIKLSSSSLGALSLGGLSPFSNLFSPSALAQGAGKQNNHVVIIQLHGGYSASFSSARSFLNRDFGGITDNNMMKLGNGLTMHNSFDRLSASVLQNYTGTVGLQHGQSSHPGARAQLFMVQKNLSVLHHLASGMGGPGSIKFAFTDGGGSSIPKAGNLNGTSLQKVSDMDGLIEALGGAVPGPYTPPSREFTTQVLTAAEKLSMANLQANSQLATFGNGLSSGIETLRQPIQTLNPQELLNAYSLNNKLVSKASLASQLACAELLMLSNTNVTLCRQPDWDTHGDPKMNLAIRKMRTEVIPALEVFISRVFGDPDNNIDPLPQFANKNVVVAIVGDFCRTAPKSGHGTGLAATVFSKNIKTGSTANVNQRGDIANSTPNVAAFWSFLASMAGAPQNTVNEIVKLGGNGTQTGLNTHLASLSRL